MALKETWATFKILNEQSTKNRINIQNEEGKTMFPFKKISFFFRESIIFKPAQLW